MVDPNPQDAPHHPGGPEVSPGDYALLEAMVEHLPVGLALLDPDGRYLRVNHALTDINDSRPEDRIGRRVADIVPEQWEQLEPHFRSVLDTGMASTFEFASLDGRHWQVTYYPVHGSDGEVRAVGSAIVEVTARKRAEEYLLWERSRFTSIVEATGYGVLQVDAAGYVQYANPAGAELLGGRPEDIEGLALAVLHEDERPPGERPFLDALQSGRPYFGQEELIRRDGGVFPAEVSSEPMRVAGEQAGAVIAFQDISERVREREEQESFIAAVSHELRSPLTSITGFARRLARRAADAPDDFDEDTADGLTTIWEQSERMRRTADLVLDVTRLSLGGYRFEREPVDLRDLLERAAASLREQAPSLEVREHYPVEPLEPASDEEGLMRIISNLLDNAAKYGGGEPVDVILEAADGQAVVSVRDRGPGLTEEEVERIFDRYYRSQSASAVRGLGLGLYISREIAGRLGGRLSAAPAKGGGTVFSLALPLQRSA